MELLKANKQWSTRPADERFPTLQALYDVTKRYADVSAEKEVPYSDIRVESIDGEVQAVGKLGNPARLTHWAFGQLSARVGAPASYLRALPATLAAQNLNHGLANSREASDTAQLLFHANGGLLLRAITSDKYSRVWNFEVAERLLELADYGWEPAVPDRIWSDDQADVTALYASDHDMFGFIRNRNVTVTEAGTDAPIYKGIIAENSEVGGAKLRLTRFLYRYMCGNHIIWGAQDVNEIALRHVGNIRDKMHHWNIALRRYADESVSELEAKIKDAKQRTIAATKEQVLDVLFGKRSLGLSRKALEASYDAVLSAKDGPPNTFWGFAQGITRYSQTLGSYTDERMTIDRAAGKVLDIAF